MNSLGSGTLYGYYTILTPSDAETECVLSCLLFVTVGNSEAVSFDHLIERQPISSNLISNIIKRLMQPHDDLCQKIPLSKTSQDIISTEKNPSQNSTVYNPIGQYPSIQFFLPVGFFPDFHDYYCFSLGRVVTMEYHGINVITLGDFLERYCFRESYTCPNESCDTSMVNHIRRFVHGRGSLQVLLKRLDLPIPGSSSNIVMWSWCRLCKQVGDAMMSLFSKRFVFMLL